MTEEEKRRKIKDIQRQNLTGDGMPRSKTHKTFKPMNNQQLLYGNISTRKTPAKFLEAFTLGAGFAAESGSGTGRTPMSKTFQVTSASKHCKPLSSDQKGSMKSAYMTTKMSSNAPTSLKTTRNQRLLTESGNKSQGPTRPGECQDHNSKLSKNCPYLLDLGQKLPQLTTPSLVPWEDVQFQMHFNNPERKFLDRQQTLYAKDQGSPSSTQNKKLVKRSGTLKGQDPNDLFDNVDYSELGGIMSTTRMRSEPDDLGRGIFVTPMYDDKQNPQSDRDPRAITEDDSEYILDTKLSKNDNGPTDESNRPADGDNPNPELKIIPKDCTSL